MPKGTPEQFLEALNMKIEELETYTSIDSAAAIQVAPECNEPIYGEYGNPYISDLMAKVIEEAPHPITNWTVSDRTIYIDVDEGMGDIVTYNVPLDELGMDYDAIYKDVNYIVSAMAAGQD